jgi:hypothetical protein
MYGKWGMAPSFLALTLGGGEWSASSPGSFTPWKRTFSTHWIDSWVDSRAGLDAVEYRNVSRPCLESNHDRPTCSWSLYRSNSCNLHRITNKQCHYPLMATKYDAAHNNMYEAFSFTLFWLGLHFLRCVWKHSKHEFSRSSMLQPHNVINYAILTFNLA